MNFLNPFFLFGLAASALPIIIHLLNQRKQKKVEFSSLKFLKELQQTKIRRLKLRQWLLLLLRTLIIIFIVLAFSRPAIEQSIPGFISYSRSSSLMVIDNSFSMDLADNYGQRFRRAQNLAKELSSKIGEGDKISVNGLESRNSSFNTSIEEINDKIDEVQISSSKMYLQSALVRFEQALIDDNNLNRNLVLLTDMQSNLLNAIDSNVTINSIANVSVIRMGEGSSNFNNVSIDSVNVVSSLFKANMTLELDVYLQNHSNESINGLVISLVINNERIAQRSVDIDGGEQKEISIASQISQVGVIDGRIELEPDALDKDNNFYFSFIIPEKPSVALISNKNNSFTELALSSKVSDLAELSVYSSDDLSRIELSDHEIIVISNADLNSSNVSRLIDHINNGGNVLLFPTDNSINSINDLMKGIGAKGIKGEFYREEPRQITSIDKQHPIFEGVFSGSTDRNSIVESPSINKAFFAIDAFPIIELGGNSFLSEIDHGEGKLIYCAVAADLSWSDLPLKGIFPVLLNSSISYLSSSDEIEGSLISGANKKIMIRKKDAFDKNFKIIDPNGIESFVQGVDLPSGVLIEMNDLNIDGNYVVYNSKDKALTSISVNHDPDESILNNNDEDWRSKFIKLFSPQTNINFYVDSSEIDNELLKQKAGTEIWQLFILLAILCAVAEMFVQKVYKNDIT